MCGRFYDIHDLDDITTRFRVDRPRDLSLPFRYNVAPTQIVPVIRVENEERELILMRWGLIPHWAKDEKIGYRMINARVLTSVPQEELELVPVSDWMNSARHDDARCLEPR